MSDPTQKPNVPPADAQTLQQSPESFGAAVDISLQDVRQSDYAPKIPGYALADLLGEGAYGQVWRATQLRTRKEVAIKVFIQRGGLDWIFLQREVERLTRLDRHPHIVTLLDTDLESEPPCYAMDLIEGGSLEKFVTGEHVDEQLARRFMRQICEALFYVHAKGLIHCDLKPGNVLVDEQTNVRVVDFGQSRVFTESAASLGTLYFMAPEQAQLASPGEQVHPDVRWDVYALGATIYAILVGEAPRSSTENDKSLAAAGTLNERLNVYRTLVDREVSVVQQRLHGVIGDEFAAVLTKCLAPDPEKRYDSVSGIQADLLALAEKRPVSPLAGRKSYRVKKFVQRNPFQIGLVIAALILAPALYIAREKQSRANESLARTILSMFDHDPLVAIKEFESAHEGVLTPLKERCREHLFSPSPLFRKVGARAAIVVLPEAFFEGVDGGLLWTGGQWLDAIDTVWDDPSRLVPTLTEKASHGTDRQKYVAFCMIGQLVGEGGVLAPFRASFAELSVRAAENERWPGVSAAARWAAQRCGASPGTSRSELAFEDEVSGLSFVRIPDCLSYRRGADPSDKLQDDDERLAEYKVSIGDLYVATTEVTYGALAKYLDSIHAESAFSAQEKAYGENEVGRKRIRAEITNIPADELERRAAAFMGLTAARGFCDWLNERAAGVMPARRYRLLTEPEWEYACRGGNAGRYCYGDGTEYAPYFANIEGVMSMQRVAERMPNWYGLFDMHGGLWELCDSCYEDSVNGEPKMKDCGLYVARGGAFYGSPKSCRSTQRLFITADAANQYSGVRLAMEMK